VRKAINQRRSNSYREILRVALPISLEAVFQTSFSFIDQIIVGLLGSTAVAAVGLSNSISFIVVLLYSAIGTGSAVLVAQAYGRQDMNEVSRIAALGQILAAVFGLCTALPLVLFSNSHTSIRRSSRRGSRSSLRVFSTVRRLGTDDRDERSNDSHVSFPERF
jgi:Na+-driven multidrug efflux pump